MCVSYGARWRARGDHSPRATRQQLRSFYIESAPHELEHLAVIARVFSLALRLSFKTRFVSAGPSSLRFVSAGSLAFCLVFASVLLSSLLSTLLQSVSSLPRLRLSLVAWPSTLTITPLIHILVL